jgi:hypothetical protein
MKSSGVVALGGAVVALGSAALLTLMAGDSPMLGPSATSDAPAGLAAGPPAPDLARMRGEVAALRAQVAGLDARAEGGATAGEEAVPARALTQEEKLAADEELHAAYIAGVEETYGREPADPAWAASTTSRVWETVRQMDFMRDAARSVECRSHMCRMEVADDGTGSLHKNLPVFGQQFADVLPVMAGKPVRDEQGHQRMVLYLMEMDRRPPAAVD